MPSSAIIGNVAHFKHYPEEDCGERIILVRTDKHQTLGRVNKKYAEQASIYTRALQEAYRIWGGQTLKAIAEFRAEPENATRVAVHYHHADSLAMETIRKAEKFLRSPEDTVLYVSLDDMIDDRFFRYRKLPYEHRQVRFSRLYDVQGVRKGYVGSPGCLPLDEQLDGLSKEIADAKQSGGRESVNLVLLEDNVRRAETMNWFIEKMDTCGILDQAKLAGIATCFSVASADERQRIQARGKIVPVVVGANYDGRDIDHVTTRDCFFDGRVVECDDQLGRLSTFFMGGDALAGEFKVHQDRAESFYVRIGEINKAFCERVFERAQVNLCVGDFDGGEIVAKVMGVSSEKPMRELIRDMLERKRRPATLVIPAQHSLHV